MKEFLLTQLKAAVERACKIGGTIKPIYDANTDSMTRYEVISPPKMRKDKNGKVEILDDDGNVVGKQG